MFAGKMLNLPPNKQLLKSVVDNFPAGVAIWYLKPFCCVLNRSAVQLTGFSAKDFRDYDSLWYSRVHPKDQNLVSSARERLRKEMDKVTCDYRFVPSGSKKEIWIREVSLPLTSTDQKVNAIFSIYTDVSDLLVNINRGMDTTRDLYSLIEGLNHDIRNHIHAIIGATELMNINGAIATASREILDKAKRINRLVQEVDEYFFPPQTRFSAGNVTSLVHDVIFQMENQLRRRGIHLEWVQQDSLPNVSVDDREIRKAIKRVLDFSAALLPKGGKLKLRARQRKLHGRRFVELMILSCSANSLEVDEERVFQPFLQVQKFEAGLSLALAREAMYRNHGQIFFRKTDSRRGLFSLLLETDSKQ